MDEPIVKLSDEDAATLQAKRQKKIDAFLNQPFFHMVGEELVNHTNIATVTAGPNPTLSNDD